MRVAEYNTTFPKQICEIPNLDIIIIITLIIRICYVFQELIIYTPTSILTAESLSPHITSKFHPIEIFSNWWLTESIRL